MKGFFIAGTDTGVGKTQVAAALCALLARRGLRPVARSIAASASARSCAICALDRRESA